MWTSFVRNIDYDAKGQRLLIAYGSGAVPAQQGVTTTYEYDPQTFRLRRLQTTRPAGLNGTISQLFVDPAIVQDLRYTYDPAGNISHIEDAALKTISHNQQQVAPVCAYTYDAIYRLIEAQGREHSGQTAHNFNPPNRRDFDFAGLANFAAHPNDLQAMRIYTESYVYDAVGNFDHVRHSANGGSWTRTYEYDAASLIEPAQQSNRLTKTTVGNMGSHVETYTYTDGQGNDVHGCMTAINTMQMTWDFADQLGQVDLQGGGTAYYVYDAAGQRVRKVLENQLGTPVEERLYLGGFEVYRKFAGDDAGLVRETLHIMDDKQRIALVETRTQGNEPDVPPQLIRYQLGNHLGSASVELDQNGGLISYEEYHPYGTTSFQAGRSAAEVSRKRYRYTGKERDEETGFSYHGARYYAPWLGRWASCDPLGIGDTNDLYVYARCTPTVRTDTDGMKSSPVNTTVSNPLLDKTYQTVSTAQQHRDRTKSTGWGETHANDLSAPVGTSVYAATSGHIVYIVQDARPHHEGPVFGDQVWIRTDDGKIESFYTHIDLTPEILNEIKGKGEEKNGRISAAVNIKIARGAKIGSITTWDNHPNGSHLHFSMAFRNGPKDYQGIDPEQVLTSTKGTALGRQVSFSDDGNYTVSSQTEPTLPNLPHLSLKLPEFPTFAGISKSGTPRLDLELAPSTMPPLPQAPAIGSQLNVPEVKLTVPKMQFKQHDAENSSGYRPKLKPIFQLQAP